MSSEISITFLKFSTKKKKILLKKKKEIMRKITAKNLTNLDYI